MVLVLDPGSETAIDKYYLLNINRSNDFSGVFVSYCSSNYSRSEVFDWTSYYWDMIYDHENVVRAIDWNSPFNCIFCLFFREICELKVILVEKKILVIALIPCRDDIDAHWNDHMLPFAMKHFCNSNDNIKLLIISLSYFLSIRSRIYASALFACRSRNSFTINDIFFVTFSI